ncbi:MAG: hypothetical protein WCF85_02265 [Rhodospirillaceae bacterium]
MRLAWIVGLCGLVLTACTGAEMAAGGLVGMTTLPQTGKLPTDHLASWASGRDCSILNYEKDGVYCPPEKKDIDRSKLYCTRTLGAVECHERPNPYAGIERPLGSPPPPPSPP